MVRESAQPAPFTPGMIGFSNNKEGGRIIRFFTRSRISHTFVFTFTLKGIPAVQEASASVQIVPFLSRYHGNPSYSYEVYEVTAGSVTEEDVESTLSRIFEEFAGVKYGWLQTLWFPYRWFLEAVLGRRDVHRKKNWFTHGVICSELLFWYLKYLDPLFSTLLKEYDADTIQPGDLLEVVKAHPEYFRLVASQE
ncbi:MAG: hypothetical protein WBD30_17205 [Bacteroidota bacterium]